MSLVEFRDDSMEKRPEIRGTVVNADPFGLAPAYHTRSGDGIVISGDLAKLAAERRESRRLDGAAVYGYLCFSYVPAPTTIYSGVRALPAGASCSVSGSDVWIESTVPWLEKEPLATDEVDAVDELQRLLRSAVLRNLGDCDMVGVFLS